MKIAVLGVGLMGRPMAERLKAAGHAGPGIQPHEKMADLSKVRIDIAERPEDAVRDAACVILMLADVEAIRDVLLRSPARKELHGRTVIQMGTIGPRESRSLQEAIIPVGGDYLEAPVLGSLVEVRSGKLIVMVGGTPEQFARWADLLRCFGPEPRLIGPMGQAAALKLALN